MSTTRHPPAPSATRSDSNAGAADGLTAFLADTYLLMGKTQACHWNVKGPNFQGLHTLFEAQYTELFAAVDVLAERIRALGSPAPMTIQGMLALSTLSEPDAIPDAATMARMLGEDHAALAAAAARLAHDIEHDLATHDLLVARIAAHDKAAWMLRSHLA
ncbi:Dps family protein [Roseomonas fluvialis]|uniref:DNA starvation/stationary phase protection protein n=1 Tax=Roseomonas fluvialis TaxID=1750527 RepID=A0ABN6P7N2_9PROT|nr:DNA starvation/stationary phase protection protein [Roseomonas fluvialis]BDG74803.1 DNA starvation/stationary phase protection protein [Roseomonas fluvialis]